MNTEANKRIHALLGHCLGSWRAASGEAWQPHPCFKCGKNVGEHKPVPDYFSETLPDNLRVAMVTAAVEKFGALGLCAEIFKTAFDVVPQANNMPTTMLLLPAPAIAEAIDKLLLADDETGR